MYELTALAHGGDTTARWLEPAVEMLVDEGMSYAKTAEALNERGYVSCQGKQFSRQLLYISLKNFGINIPALRAQAAAAEAA